VRTGSEASAAPNAARREIAAILAGGYLRLLQERARGAPPPAHSVDAGPPEKKPETLPDFP